MCEKEIIRHLHELNNSALQPDLHKGITLSTSTINNTPIFADDQIISVDSEDNVQRGVSTLKT
jgi:hypothetical protein